MKIKLTIIIEKANGNYSAYCPQVPGCVATGKDEEETYQNMVEALRFHMEGLKEDNLPTTIPCTVKEVEIAA